MKKLISLTLSLIMLLSCGFFVVSCDDTNEEKMLYTEDTALGTGAKQITFTVEHMDGTKVSFTIKTDKTILSEALLEHGLIEGEDGAYGLYVKKVNGITHDYHTNGSYWSLYIGSEYAQKGVDATDITDGGSYTFKASK